MLSRIIENVEIDKNGCEVYQGLDVDDIFVTDWEVPKLESNGSSK
jgi:hypothetical protein